MRASSAQKSKFLLCSTNDIEANLKEAITEKEQLLRRIASLRSPNLDGLPRGNRISDPTARAVLDNEELLKQADEHIVRYQQDILRAEYLWLLPDRPECKQVLRLRFFEGLSVLQAASEMDISEATTKMYTRAAFEAIAAKTQGGA